MMTRLLAVATIVAASALANPALAGWQAEQDPFSNNFWRVTNSETGQTLPKAYKSEKQAKKAAKVLNKGDKSVMAGPNGEGDFRHGGELPR